jgi:hypothetical protein
MSLGYSNSSNDGDIKQRIIHLEQELEEKDD